MNDGPYEWRTGIGLETLTVIVTNVYLFYVLFAGFEGLVLVLKELVLVLVLALVVLTTRLYKSPSSDISNITLLPIIDMNLSDNTCMHSVLCFVESEAMLLNIYKACVAFDQPLWVEAVEIVQ